MDKKIRNDLKGTLKKCACVTELHPIEKQCSPGKMLGFITVTDNKCSKWLQARYGASNKPTPRRRFTGGANY